MNLSIRPLCVLEKSEDSTVYRGELTDFKSLVLVRETLHPSLREANFTIQEAIITSKLQHPAICEVYDCRLEDSEGYVKSVHVAETLDLTLAELILERAGTGVQFAEEELMNTLRQLAGALSFAQRHNVSHRDVRPHNVFCSRDLSVIKIGQFTFAKKYPDEVSQSIAGAPLYLSPKLKEMYLNLLRGEPQEEFNPYKSDVYSLGMVMLHMALLHPPEEFVNLTTLPNVTAAVIQNLASYRIFAKVLRRMLEMVDDLRPDFIALDDLVHEVMGIPREPHSNERASVGLFWRLSQQQQTAIPDQPVQRTEIPDTDSPAAVSVARPCGIEERHRPAVLAQIEGGRYTEPQPAAEKCVYCPASLCGGVPLPCGHSFHSADCLLSYVLDATSNFTQLAVQCCPQCSSPLPAGFVPRVLGTELEARRQEVQKSACCVCGSYVTFKRLACSHLICIGHAANEEICKFCLRTA